MKRMIELLIAMLLTLGLAACNNGAEEPEHEESVGEEIEDDAEEAGEDIEEAADETEDEIDEEL